MKDRTLYLETAEAWLGAKLGDRAYSEMLTFFNMNPYGIKADNEDCCEFTVACAIKTFGKNQKFIPVSNYSNGQAKMWGKLAAFPSVGSLAYFDYKDGNGISHVEIVTDITETEIKTINGNAENHKVERMSRKFDYKYFAGFGVPEWKEGDIDMTEWQKAAAGQIVLKKGSAGTMVVWLQKYLKKQGFYKTGTLDGIFGNVMNQAVRDWQRSTGVLYVDAIVARNCWAYILRDE